MFTSKEALNELIKGNRRYVSGKIIHATRSHQRRQEVALRQYPLAVVVGCSDSRVPLEVIFDQGFGDLFVIRSAGNVIDKVGLASVEFAVHFLMVPLVIVVGHKRCSAVQAAMHNQKAPGHIHCLIDAIKPSVKKSLAVDDKAWERAVKSNVRMVARQLAASNPVLKGRVAARKLLVVGGFYDLDTGKVGILK